MKKFTVLLVAAVIGLMAGCSATVGVGHHEVGVGIGPVIAYPHDRHDYVWEPSVGLFFFLHHGHRYYMPKGWEHKHGVPHGNYEDHGHFHGHDDWHY